MSRFICVSLQLGYSEWLCKWQCGFETVRHRSEIQFIFEEHGNGNQRQTLIVIVCKVSSRTQKVCTSFGIWNELYAIHFDLHPPTIPILYNFVNKNCFQRSKVLVTTCGSKPAAVSDGQISHLLQHCLSWLKLWLNCYTHIVCYSYGRCNYGKQLLYSRRKITIYMGARTLPHSNRSLLQLVELPAAEVAALRHEILAATVFVYCEHYKILLRNTHSAHTIVDNKK